MHDEINPYASPETKPDTPAKPDDRSWRLRTMRALTVGPALLILVLLALANLTVPVAFFPMIGAIVLLHIADRKLFKSKGFLG